MDKKITVIRKNGTQMPFDDNKIKSAVMLSGLTIGKDVKEGFLNTLSSSVYNAIQRKNSKSESCEVIVTVNEIHDLVIQALEIMDKDIHKQYKDYRNYKQRYTKSFENIKEDTMKIVYSGDKENANKDSSIISTQKELIAGVVSQEMMIEWELPTDAKQKHKNGQIYIHDLRDHMFDSINCCIFDLEKLLSGGFEMNGIQIEEPETFESFMDLAIDVLLVASSQQFGGFSYSELDRVGAKYLENTYNRILNELLSYGVNINLAKDKAYNKTWEICLKKIRMFEYKINSVLNATGQTPFASVGFGLDTSKFGRMISKAMLTVRIEGMGKNKVTAIFPKLIFFHRNEINGHKDSPNYDIKQLAILCSADNQYPDYLSLDAGYLGEVYDRCQKPIMQMG